MKKNIFKSTVIVTSFTIFNSAVNYFTLVILASRFGTGVEMDAYFAGVTIQQVIIAILLAILYTSLVPVFVESKLRDEQAAWTFASIAFNLIFIILTFFAVLTWIFPSYFISLLNPGFSGPAIRLSASLFKIFMTSLIFSGTSVILISLYYANGAFFRPSLSQFLNGVMTLLVVSVAGRKLGIHSIAYGTLLGSLAQFLFLLTIFVNKRRYVLSLNIKMREITRMGALILPLLLGALFYKTNILVERFLASRMGLGAISYLGYANKIMAAILLLITQGLNTTLFPRMSEYAAKKNFAALKALLSKGIRVLLLITLPITILIIVKRFEIVRLFFERGNFNAQNTEAVGEVLIAYLGYFVVGALGFSLVNALYSLQKMKKVVMVGLTGFLFYVMFSFVLSRVYSYLGIALASSIQSVFCFFLFAYIIRKEIGDFISYEIFRCFGKSLLASIAACGVVFAWEYEVAVRFSFPMSFLLETSIGFAAYTVFLVFLRTEELKLIPIPIFQKK